MIIGVPKEIKDHETRVGCVPSMVIALHERGHQVLVESQAGVGSSIPDAEYVEAGATVLASAVACLVDGQGRIIAFADANE